MLLAMDTAQAACSVALVDNNGGVVGSAFEFMDRGHAECLVPMVEQVMSDSGMSMSDISRLATTVGPGSFTGLRVGLAVARGYGVALSVPVIGITTLEALVETARCNVPKALFPMVAIMDARRNEVYIQTFESAGRAMDKPARKALPVALKELPKGRFSVVGTGAPFVTAAMPQALDINITVPEARCFGVLALNRPIQAKAPNALYLRPPDAKLPGGIIPPGFEL